MALRLFFEYRYGKPIQRTEMSIDISKLSDEEVDKLLERAMQKLQSDD